MKQGALRENMNKIQYALYVIFHPFDGFYDLKNEHRGNAAAASAIFLAALATWLISRQYSGYFYSDYDALTYNVLIEAAKFVIPFFLWIVANWCLTTLMDGKGTMKDIYIAVSYALAPIVLILLPLSVFSNALSLEEASYFNFFYFLAFAWTGLLVFTGTMVTHQYLVSKTFLTCILTIAGMMIIVFVALLFYSVIQKVIFFIMNSYEELRFRFY
ncbi:MAG: YIP1 family protein [Saccharofermentanales bacterium]